MLLKIITKKTFNSCMDVLAFKKKEKIRRSKSNIKQFPQGARLSSYCQRRQCKRTEQLACPSVNNKTSMKIRETPKTKQRVP